MTRSEDERLDGWKSIARYVGRDRSTVIRWANGRDLPIHWLPGGKTRTVYALKGELDAWMRGGRSEPVDDAGSDSTAKSDEPIPVLDTTPVDTPAASMRPRAPFARGWIIATLACCAAIGAPLVYQGGIAGSAGPVEPVAREVPLDPVAGAQLLEARDDIASRSEQRLNAAIVTLRAISPRGVENVGVHESLAEAYLLAREFGSLPDALALEKARREAGMALRRNPASPTALRVIGVIAYWRDRDPRAAGRAFRQAIAAAPQDALAHHWYANILSDNGEDDAAFREFSLARRLNPGAPHLLADYAWGLWSVGRDREAEAILTDLVARYPLLASIHDCLSVIALAKGDRAGYERHLASRASARGAPELVSYSNLVDDATTRNEGSLYEIMLTRGLAQAEAIPDSDHSWPAFVASVFGDRAQLIDILNRARARDEHWGASGYTRRIVRRWSGDRDVVGAIATLRQSGIEASSVPLRRYET